MEERTQIVIDIKLDEADVAQRLSEVNWEMSNLKQANKELRQEIKKGNDDYSENSKKLAENEARLKSLQAEQKALSGQVAQATQTSRTYGTSLKEMSAKLNDLRNRYQSLDATQRASKGGQKMLKEIKELDKAMKDADAEIGIFGRNVGDYANKVAEGLSKAGVSVGGLNDKFDLLNKNPIIFVLGVITAALVKLKSSMQQNETVTASLASASNSLKPIMQGVGNVVGKLADVFSNVLNWAIEKTIQAIGWLGKTLQKVGSWFGADWGGGLTEMAANMRALREETHSTTEATETITETTEQHTKAVKEDTKAIQDNTAALEQQQKAYNEKTISEMQKAEDALNSIILDAFEKRRAIEDTAYRRKKERLQAELEAEREAHGEGTALYNSYTMQLEILEEQHAMTMAQIRADELAQAQAFDRAAEADAAKTAERIKKIEQSRYEYSAQIAHSLSDLMENVAGDNKEMVKASKIVALAEVAINQGIAISKAVASASEGDPYTYALRVASAIASTVAAMASAIASINKASSFETGGVIGGYKGASMGHDNTVAVVRTGEMVINARQQRQLFEIANGGGSNSLAVSLAQALQAMPAPVLVYSEFQEFGSRVATLDEEQRLK